MPLVIVVSGPEQSRAKAQLALEDAGLAPLPSDHHALMDWKSKLPDDPDVFLSVAGRDVNDAVRALDGIKGWRLRVHYEMPPAPEPSPEQKIAATLDEMNRRIAELEGRLSR